jgi:polar amino acid transport system substrate-binding protein
MKIKKIAMLMVVITVFLVGCSSSMVTKTSTDNATIIKEELVMGLDDQFPPMGFRNDAGDIIGFDVDVAQEVVKRLGKTLELKPIVWETKETMLQQNEIDMIWNGYSMTPARQEMVLFSQPYLTNSQIIIVRQDAEINNIADLADKVVGVQLGSSAQEAVEKNIDALESFKDLKKYDDNLLVLLDLEIGGIDAAVMDSVLGNYQIKMNDYPFKVLTENFGEESYGVGLRKEDSELAEQINMALEAIQQDGTYQKIYDKWFTN